MIFRALLPLLSACWLSACRSLYTIEHQRIRRVGACYPARPLLAGANNRF
nr:hypothetical protein [uncultured Arsenicibacter sp.]